MIISCVAPSHDVTVKRLQHNYENHIPPKNNRQGKIWKSPLYRIWIREPKMADKCWALAYIRLRKLSKQGILYDAIIQEVLPPNITSSKNYFMSCLYIYWLIDFQNLFLKYAVVFVSLIIYVFETLYHYSHIGRKRPYQWQSFVDR